MRCDDRGGGTRSSSPRTDQSADAGHGARPARGGGGPGDGGALDAVAMALACVVTMAAARMDDVAPWHEQAELGARRLLWAVPRRALSNR